MKVTVDKFSGFCWGVVRTIEIAEQELEEGNTLHSLGEIIHNPMEIERLGEKGLDTVSKSDFERLRGSKILIRAHGEPPETYKLAMQHGITIIDATCPVVTKVQERIRKFYLDGYQIVIFGKKDHAEVVGLVGQTNGEAIVVKSVKDLDEIRLDKKTVLFSQTTMDKPAFHLLKDELKKRLKDLVVSTFEDEAVEFHAKDTICGQVSGRDKKLREFARANDVVVFVAGRHSSNGKVLFDIAKDENSRTHFIERSSEIQKEWFIDAENIGVSGATSTPQWLMEQVKTAIEQTVLQAEPV